MRQPDARQREIRNLVLGLSGALALTSGAFAVVRWPLVDAAQTFAIVLGLGLLQILLHFGCFLHVSLRRSSRDNLHLILFSALIIALMVGGTLVVLANLHHRMM